MTLLCVAALVFLSGCSEIPIYTDDQRVGLSLQEFRMAQNAQKDMRYDKALDHYERSLVISERPLVHYELAMLLGDLGRYEDARAHLNAALDLSSSYEKAKRGFEIIATKEKLAALGNTPEEIAKRWQEEYVPGGDTEKPDPAESYREYLVRQGINVNEVNVKLYERGIELAGEGKTAEAIRMFREVLLDSPNDARVYYNLGNLYYQAGQQRRALIEYKSSIECDPRYVMAYNNLGVVQESLGYVDEARENYIRAIALGGYEQAHYNLAVLYEKLGETELAIKEYETFAKLQPDSPQSETAKQQLKKLYKIR